MMQSGGGGMGNLKHRTSGHATKSPKLRHAMKREAERNQVKDRSRIQDQKSTVGELFHPVDNRPHSR
jgi:hypothetical protein